MSLQLRATESVILSISLSLICPMRSCGSVTPPNLFRHLTVCLSKAFSFAFAVSSICLAAVGKRVPLL